MTQVFVLTEWCDYETGETLGVFATAEAAKLAADKSAQRLGRRDWSAWQRFSYSPNLRTRFSSYRNQGIEEFELEGAQ